MNYEQGIGNSSTLAPQPSSILSRNGASKETGYYTLEAFKPHPQDNQ